ncbi:ATP-dependent DNA helicase recQ [Poronia punctata]|nr:ATP-dependent DNA helicase recQ [Poronia punctata]
MSDYGSDDDILDGVDVDDLLQTGTKKRGGSCDDGPSQPQAKRGRLDNGKSDRNERYDSIARSLLRSVFGYDDFRHEQAGAIRTILGGENALVIFPTGAGKSLCYQIPAIAFPELDAVGLTERGQLPNGPSTNAGITIVVSPLIALMKDQVDALKRRRVPAACLDSTKTYDEQKETNAAMRAGDLRILYCAPERLNNEGFVESMKHVPGGIRLVAVDEAHCISEWGHSFRPDYLKVARFVNEIKAERVICLTATATPRVADDVRKAFNIKPAHVFRTSPYRPNLELQAEAVLSTAEKFPRLIKFLDEHDGPTLVYITTQAQTEDLAERLTKKGYSTAAFHAGLAADVKTKTQDDFMAGRIRIVVATIAFGMGIDKADIRNIVHYNVASTVEEYSQQVGRAGRDGKPSYCMLYLCRDDFWLRENFVRGDLPSRRSLQRLLEEVLLRPQVVRQPDGTRVIRLNLGELGREHDVRNAPLTIILATIELRLGYIRAITPEYSAYQFEARPGYYSNATADTSPEAKAILKKAVKAKKWYKIDVNDVSLSTGILRSDIVRKLGEFDGRGYFVLKASGVINRFKVLKQLPQSRYEVGEVTDKLYAEMEARERDDMKRFESVCDMLTDEKCFGRALAGYFGMGLPDGKSKCGHCTYCLTNKAVFLPLMKVPKVDKARVNAILDACDVRDDPRFLARVAFGIKSPRIAKLKLDRKAVFTSLQDHEFDSLLEEFTKACVKAGFDPDDKFGD